MWQVYILKCADDTLYTGITNDIERRLVAHNDGTASKYTRTRRPASIVYTAPYPDRSTASREEIRIKKLSRGEKLGLINKFPINKN